MGFNRRKLEAERKAKADAEAAARRASDQQMLADAEALIAAWNERQARHMPSCSRRQSVRRLRLGTTSCGSIAPPQRYRVGRCVQLRGELLSIFHRGVRRSIQQHTPP
jgi:hypothetical protein